VSVARAETLSTTITATGSGDLGGVPFSGASFTISTTGDTTTRETVEPGIFSVENLTASISITGLGNATFVTPTRIFNNQGGSVAGFSRARSIGGQDILNVEGAAFSTWNMFTGVGPVFDAALHPLDQADGLDTTAGTLNFTAYSAGTFTAVVPEPAALATVALGLLATARRRRRL
jgi:hypothetical protein